MRLNKLCCLALSLASTLAVAQEPKTLEREQPIVATVRKPVPYQIVPGTVVQMTMLSSEFLSVAQVTSTIYDAFGNATIPAGSRLVGQYRGQQGGRHVIYWDGLQLPEVAGTFRLDPPLLATMPDGSAGVVNLEPGQGVATIVGQSFVVPHRR